MKWGISVNVHEKFQQTIEIASQSDATGIDYIWVVDFPVPRFAPTMAVKIASMTTTSRIGIGLLPAFVYDPEYIIRFVETLVNEFGNRFDILIGPGDKEALRAIGKRDWVPSRVVDQTISSAVQIKNSLEEMDINCPVWLAAQGPRMIAESKKVDGVLLNLTDFHMAKWATSIIGKHDRSFRLGLFSPTMITQSSTDSPPNEFLYSAAIVALGASRSLLQQFDIEGEICSARQAYSESNGLSPIVLERIGENILRRWGFFLTPEDLILSIRALAKIDVDTVVFGPPISHSVSSFKLLLKAFNIYQDLAT
ncbi:MAG: LLM class flavin-dependent oxidoreductase [Candidatus Thorarchaeota archaeon]|jgi:hypothetical protein